MAKYEAYLRGGPDDGTFTTFTTKPHKGQTLTYNGSVYTIVWPVVLIQGVAEEFTFTHAAKPPPGVKTAQLHQGWNDLRRSVNVNLPAALRNSHRSLNAGLRAVERARKVRL